MSSFKLYFVVSLLFVLLAKVISHILNFNFNISVIWYFLILPFLIYKISHERIMLVKVIKRKYPLIYKKNGNNFISFNFIIDSNIIKDEDVKKHYYHLKTVYSFLIYFLLTYIFFIFIDVVI